MRFGASVGCHQRADRSFFFKGYQFPVCARCTGVMIGECVGIILLICGLRIPLTASLLSVLPLVIDGGIQYLKWLESNNLRRVVTGLVAGFGLTFAYYEGIVVLYRVTQIMISGL